MKGVILDCLKNLVSTNYGTEKWLKVLTVAGLPASQPILATSDFDDKVAINLIHATCQVLNISMPQAAEAFGDLWMNNYASKIYAAYLTNIKSSRELLLKLDSIHTRVTNTMPNAKPPRFVYQWKNDHTLIMTYSSKRELIDLFMGLAKSVAKYYKDNLIVRKLSNNQIEIIFS